MSRLLGCGLMSLAGLLSMCASAHGIWPQDGGNPAADGVSKYPGPRELKIDWEFELDGWGTSPVIAPDGTVYVGTNHGTLYAIGQDGQLKWQRRWRGPRLNRPEDVSEQEWEERVQLGLDYAGTIFSCALSADGMIYVAQGTAGAARGKRQLLALDANGVTVWSLDVGAANVAGKLTVDHAERILFTTSDHRVCCVSPQGKLIWSTLLGDHLSSVAVGADGTVYVAGDRLRGLDGNTGAVKWTAPEAVFSPTWIFGPAVSPDGTVYVVSGVRSEVERYFFAFSPRLELQWKKRVGVVEMTPAIAPDGDVFLHVWGDARRRYTTGNETIRPGLHRLGNDGRLKWSLPKIMATPRWALDDNPPGSVMGSDSSPAISANGIVYFGSDIGKVFAVDTAGKVLSEVSLGGEFDTRPAIGPTRNLCICHAGGPGAWPHGTAKCYSFSESGRRPPSREQAFEASRNRASKAGKIAFIRERIGDLERSLKRAQQAGDQTEVQEIRAILRELRAELAELTGG